MTAIASFAAVRQILPTAVEGFGIETRTHRACGTHAGADGELIRTTKNGLKLGSASYRLSRRLPHPFDDLPAYAPRAPAGCSTV